MTIMYCGPSPGGKLSESERRLLMEDAEHLALPGGTCIFQRGAPGDRMYWIEEGEVEIQFKEGETGKLLGPGESFGEIALLTGGSVRTASAYTTCPTRLRMVKQAAVEHLRATRPEVLCTLLQRTCAYLVHHEYELMSTLNQRNRELEQNLDYLRRTREELDASEMRANTDKLTELYNRRCFDHQLPRFMLRAEEEGWDLALALIDLDKFKPVNDTYGHAAGDTVLISLGRLLKSHACPGDLPCRIGGDEFALLFNETTAEAGKQRISRLREAIAAMNVRIPPISLTITVSIGASLFISGDTPDSLFCRADESLYQSKQQGRNRATWEGETL